MLRRRDGDELQRWQPVHSGFLRRGLELLRLYERRRWYAVRGRPCLRDGDVPERERPELRVGDRVRERELRQRHVLRDPVVRLRADLRQSERHVQVSRRTKLRDADRLQQRTLRRRDLLQQRLRWHL